MEEVNPERQNAINSTIELSDRHVIHRFLSRQQETVEGLVDTFTYFTLEKEDTSATSACTGNSPKETDAIPEANRNTATEQQDHREVKTDEDGIEEEVLDEGSKAGTMSGSTKLPNSINMTKPNRQFGNFVDEATSDDEEKEEEGVELGQQGYSSSFATQDTTKTLENQHKKIDKLPHETEKSADCELSAIVDSLYEEGELEEGEVEVGGCTLNPGEVEDVPDELPSISDLQQVTCLQMTTTRENTTVSDSTYAEVCTDEVQDFKLDEDFDYDNVKLTPKFSTEELDYLKSFIPTQT